MAEEKKKEVKKERKKEEKKSQIKITKANGGVIYRDADESIAKAYKKKGWKVEGV